MKILEDLKPEFGRQLKHTWVKGRDEKGYKVLTLQLYDRQAPPEFANWEVSVVEVDERGKIRTLVQPLLKRFFERTECCADGERRLEGGQYGFLRLEARAGDECDDDLLWSYVALLDEPPEA